MIDSVAFELPWPPSSLSGHNTGHWKAKSSIVAKHRQWAFKATLAVRDNIEVPETGDIRVSATFYPPDRRSDRANMPARLKPYWDGVADGLHVNDRRFLPIFRFAEPVKNPCVVITIGG